MMIIEKLHSTLPQLEQELDGKIKFDSIYREIYATDASIYYEKPIGVAFPKNANDVQKIIQWANKHACPIIPRGAGTSLAGQVVGGGLIVDVSRYMNSVVDVNETENWVRIQPGIVQDELNQFLKKHNRLFGPETSTANRCVLGGMLGNNSCGLHSLVYGNVRDHVLEITGYLSNGDKMVFSSITKKSFKEKCKLDTLEGQIYQQIDALLTAENIKEIRDKYPDKALKRRNNGYALDALAEMMDDESTPFNFCKLIAGSEGTLFFTTEIKLNILPLPPNEKALMNIHCNSVNESLIANNIALKYKPTASELMDKPILELATKNALQNQNLSFIHGTPGAVLMVEFWADTKAELVQLTQNLENDLIKAKVGYSFPVVFNADIGKVWNVRKAGLGVLANMPGDAKPTCIIEDTAVTPDKLPAYIEEMDAMMAGHGKEAVYYAHAGSGELHIRPIINLKSHDDRVTMRAIAEDTLKLVKKYNGSISGEHGDGRLRGEFLEAFYGEEIYQWFTELKNTWDPNGIFNPNKIVNAPRMDENLRVFQEKQTPPGKLEYTWTKSMGFLKAIENCTGSGDCRKSEKIGGAMCPSFMALKDEKSTTRARANALRSYLYGEKNGLKENEVAEVLDLCLSCKACKSECPSNVDMAKMKAEFLHQYYQNHRIPLRSKLIGNISGSYKLMSIASGISNLVLKSPASNLVKAFVGIHPKRSLPPVEKFKRPKTKLSTKKKQRVIFYLDEFTQYNDGLIGAKTVSLLENLGYEVIIPPLKASGRTYISKGILGKAKQLAKTNIQILSDLFKTEQLPIIGSEPSAILTFRDEYTEFFSGEWNKKARHIAEHVFTIEEYLHKELKLGNILPDAFTSSQKDILFHGHCYQKALSSTLMTKEILSIPTNYSASEIASGCCGMAGSFGYEKEHYDVSMKIGNITLFPTIKNATKETLIVAAGTSCRHQIKDGTSTNALHPVEVLFDALINN